METLQTIVGIFCLLLMTILVAYLFDAPIIIPAVMALRFVQEVDKDFPHFF